MSFGRFERSPGPRPMSEINMTPLIDVMLVLLVIFIITAPLLASSIRLDLPKTDAARAGDAPKSVLVVVDKSGQAFLSDRPLDLAELATQLLQVATTSPDTEVQLRADRRSALRAHRGRHGRGAKSGSEPDWFCGGRAPPGDGQAPTLKSADGDPLVAASRFKCKTNTTISMLNKPPTAIGRRATPTA